MVLLCNRLQFLCLVSLLFFVLGSWVSPIQISDAAVAYESEGYTGRSLLQTQKECPVDFQSQNYTILTSQCKGPNYLPTPCCKALKEFACPFIDEIDDVSNNCANTMFSYITINGNYPPGLFASECKEGKNGLDCQNVTTPGAVTPPSGNGVGFLGCGLLRVLGLGFGSCLIGGLLV